jgi:hypothetical protein
VLLVAALLLALGASTPRSGVVTQVNEVLAATSPAPQAAVDLRPVTYREKRFLESWEYDRRNGLPKSLQPDSWQHYEISYDVDTATAMYRATGSSERRPGQDNGWFSDGFVKLGRYDRATQRRLEDHQIVNAQLAANMALNAKTLSPSRRPQ